MSSIFRTMSRRSTDSQDTVVNSEEINYPKIQNDLDNWKLPKVSNQEIYKKETLKFFYRLYYQNLLNVSQLRIRRSGHKAPR